MSFDMTVPRQYGQGISKEPSPVTLFFALNMDECDEGPILYC